MNNSEVAVRQNGHEHAVAAPDLDGQLHVDLDADNPDAVLTVPPGVGVQYRDDADKVALRRILESFRLILVDDETRGRHAGRGRQREVSLRVRLFGCRYLYLAWR